MARRKPSHYEGELVSIANSRSTVTESYRSIRTNLQFACAVNDAKIIQVTSTLPSEGKTSTVSNTAIVTAEAGKRVLLIDADLRKPQVHHRFRVTNITGLSTCLVEEASLPSCIVPSGVEGLDLIPSGPIPPNPSELLSSKRMQTILSTLRDSYDIIFIDSPPILSVSDSLVLSNLSDGIIFVVNGEKTNRKLAQKATHALKQVQANILGVVLNQVPKQPGDGYYNYYYYAAGTSAGV